MNFPNHHTGTADSSYLSLLEDLKDAVWNSYIAVFAAGLLLNGWMVFTALYHRKRVLLDRLDRVMLYILIICVFWSFFSAINGILYDLGQVTNLERNWYAICSSGLIGILVVANLALAAERFCLICQKSSQYERRTMIAVLLFLACHLISVLVVFIQAPSTDGVIPGDHNVAIVWAWCLLFGFVVANTFIFALYAATFKFSAQTLEQNNSLVEIIARSGSVKFVDSEGGLINSSDLYKTLLETQKKLLINSLIMSSVIAILYIPIIVFIIVTVLSNAREETGICLGYLGKFFVACDVLASPVLILYFSRGFRHAACFWKWKELGAKEAVVEAKSSYVQ
ncbi:hypothetical protein BC830DRAFT_1127717 [Chytriomyces sp. MP71]|nr:hypothetical protein BC830DRAFT_1127717 [Chytriomyces sp. MP71]